MARSRPIPLTVTGAFSDRGQEAPGISQPTGIAPWNACEVLSFIFGNRDTITPFHLIISGYPEATDDVYHPLFSFTEYSVACCGDEGERTLRNLGAFAEASARPTEALAEVGAKEGSGFGEFFRIPRS